MVKINPVRPLVAALTGAFVLICLAIAFVPAPVSSSDWAAWVQGIGTISAVGLATWYRPLRAGAPGGVRAVSRADRLEQAVSSLHRASTDLELAIWDGDFRRVRDGVAVVSEGPAMVSLEQLIGRPAWTWPSAGLRAGALEIRQAVGELTQLLPEPEPGADDELAAWWETLKTAAAHLRLVTNRLLKDLDGVGRD